MINDELKDNNVKNTAKAICQKLGIEIDEFDISKLEDLNATLVFSDTNERGIGGIIIGDDGTFLICGSLYAPDYYIEEFKKGKRDNLL